MSFGERIKQYIDYKQVSIRAFEIESSLKNGAVSRVVKNNTSLNGESIASIGRKWEDLNLNWLLTGEGTMLNDALSFGEPENPYQKDPKIDNQLDWYQDALKRADSHIALQNELIAALKKIIKTQEKATNDTRID
jgi:hypothetical protein